MEKYNIGTDLKFAVSITSTGFSMDTDPWTATVVCGNKGFSCSRGTNTVVDGDGQWYILVDTTKLGKGNYYLVADIDVPDDDFDDGYRHEVLQQDKPLCVVKEVYTPKTLVE